VAVNNTWQEEDGDVLQHWLVEFTLRTHWLVEPSHALYDALVQLEANEDVPPSADARILATSADGWISRGPAGHHSLHLAAGAGTSKQPFAQFLGKTTWDNDTYGDPQMLWDASLLMYRGPDRGSQSVQCQSPVDSGASPACGSQNVYTASTSNVVPVTAQGDAAVGSCTFRQIATKLDPQYGTDLVDAAASPYYPPGCCNDDARPDYCVPWADTSGMFFGDGTYRPVALELQHSAWDSRLGGMLVTAEARLQHLYHSRKLHDDMPYTAHFSGGPRSPYVHNAASGRFRIESTVNIQAKQCASTHCKYIPNNVPP
jgi:hypothetical protein